PPPALFRQMTSSNPKPATIRHMPEGSVIRLNLANAAYEITVRPDILHNAGPMVAALAKSPRVAIVTDSNVGPLHAKTLTDSLESAGLEPIIATIPAGEANKNLRALLPIYDQLLSARLERSTPLIALGGGVVGDMAGFVAATILRGIPLIQMPTTLLAMVDASIGGKTGVDHAMGKNLIGAFHQPVAVLIDPKTLLTLPPREFRSGLAECIKHDLIRDAVGFAALEKNLDRILARDISDLSDLIAHNVAIKARVVEADPFEKGERAHLNFGHTFGHAIESVSQFSYAHGEAIALGMTAAAFTSMKLGLLTDADFRRIKALLERAGLPTYGLTLNGDAIIQSMQFDKKVKSGRIRFVLLDGIGRAVIRDDVPASLVREAVESLRA
ncbi:MAG: 3-dehydroquinate synthase, partial [Tepidisphaeraceae bacterium]